MKSDTPDELFVFPDRNFSDRSNITQEDIDDMSVDFSFPLRNRKSKVLPESKPLTNLQKQKLRKLHDLKTSSRNKFGLRPGEYIDKRTGEIKSRFNRAEALRKAGESTKYGLRRFGVRRRIRF